MSKTIIVVQGGVNQGKTESIRSIFDRFKEKNILIEEKFFNSEVVAIFEENGIKIGINSIGDPNSSQKDWLKHLVSEECKIIITASRTRGETVININDLANLYNYTTIWTSNYVCHNENKENTHKLNILFANAILKLTENI